MRLYKHVKIIEHRPSEVLTGLRSRYEQKLCFTINKNIEQAHLSILDKKYHWITNKDRSSTSIRDLENIEIMNMTIVTSEASEWIDVQGVLL